MSLLINEWNKISEILESINVDPNNMINSLISIYGEQTVRSFNLSIGEITNSNIELDVNIDDIPIPDIGDNNVNKFDPSNMTIMNLIQVIIKSIKYMHIVLVLIFFFFSCLILLNMFVYYKRI